MKEIKIKGRVNFSEKSAAGIFSTLSTGFYDFVKVGPKMVRKKKSIPKSQ